MFYAILRYKSATKYIPEKSYVLDVGCGNGLFYNFIKNKKVKYFGVDISKEAISLARKIG